MITAKFAVRMLAISLALTSSVSMALADSQGGAQPSAEIAALKKHVAEQDERIALLEKEVGFLLREAKQPPAAKAQGASAPPRAGISAPAASQAAASLPRDTPAATRPSEPAAPTQSRGAALASEKPPSRIKVAGIDVGGDVYLYQYAPFGVPGARPRFELYAFSLKLHSRKGPWEFYTDYRFRTTKLRSFYPGNTWLQEGYVGYRTRFGEIRAGSFYRHVGLVWDDSFFGNIQYFDGLKLDPEFGIGFEGTHKLSDHLSVAYSTQYFTTDGRVNGSLPGRDFVSEPNAHAKNDGTFRFAPVWHFRPDLSLTLGASYARGTIERDGGPNNIRSQVAGDATLAWRGLLTYAEVLDQHVDGILVAPPGNATYTLFGARWARGRFQPRLNFSAANYHGLNPRREFILQPGITVRMYDGFSFLYEFDYWKETSIPHPFLLDKSLNFVLLYHF